MSRAKAVVDQPPTGEAGTLERDARAVHRALSELIRIVQFRDRDVICCHDISVSQCYALQTMALRGPLTLNELVAALYLDKSTGSRLVEALVNKGYVTRQPHPEDGRAVLLEPTAEGRRLYRRIEADLLEEARRVLADIDPDLRAALVPLLTRLVRSAGERIESRAGRCRLRD